LAPPWKPTNRLAGYYTLAGTSVPANDLPTEVLKRLPRYPILPAALVGRLAVDQSFHRKGLGSTLLADAALRVLKGDTKAFALIVEADMRELDLSRRGAFARFKDLLDRRGVLDQWYDFEAKAEERALRMWCDLNSIDVSDE
jgi:GNAT superfamily N-acetyltransferase